MSDKKNKDIHIPMNMVYASPQFMVDSNQSDFLETSLLDDTVILGNNNEVYPTTLMEKDEDNENELYMKEVYGSPDMLMNIDYKNNIQSQINPVLDNTPLYCIYCGKKLNNSSDKCTYCGKRFIIYNPEDTIKICIKCGSTISIEAKYCSVCGTKLYTEDDHLSSNNKKVVKQNIFSKLFKRYNNNG